MLLAFLNSAFASEDACSKFLSNIRPNCGQQKQRQLRTAEAAAACEPYMLYRCNGPCVSLMSRCRYSGAS